MVYSTLMRVGTTRREFALLGLPALATTLPTNLMAAQPFGSIEIGPDRPVGEPRAIQVEPYIAANPSPGSPPSSAESRKL